MLRQTLFFGMILFQGPALAEEQDFLRDQEFEFSRRGTCQANELSVPMERVYLLEKRQEVSPNGTRYVLSGERVKIQPLDADAAYFYKVDLMISPSEDLDLSLDLAIYSGEFFIYWRQTYQDRIYRQGLLRWDNSILKPYCEGLGGVKTSH